MSLSSGRVATIAHKYKDSFVARYASSAQHPTAGLADGAFERPMWEGRKAQGLGSVLVFALLD